MNPLQGGYIAMIKGITRVPCWRRWNTLNVSTLFLLLTLSPVFIMNMGIVNAAEETLPDPAVIMDKIVEVTGGLETHRRIQNRVTKGTFEIVMAGIKNAIITYQAKPHKAYTKMESEAMGTFESGSNGDVAWEKSTITGPKVKEGEERADALRDAFFDPQANWRAFYHKVESLGMKPVDGRPCYKIVVTPNIGGPQTLYIDKNTYLILKVEWVSKQQMGTIPIEVFVSEYKNVDGILIPHKAKTRFMGQEMIFTITSVEHNVKMSPDFFKLPEEIRALVDTSRK